MWNRVLCACFMLNTFKRDNTSVWRYIKICESRRKVEKLKSIHKVSLSIWHLEKRCHGEVSQDILWHLKKSAEVSWFDKCANNVKKNVGLKSNKTEHLMKSPLISAFCQHQVWQNRRPVEPSLSAFSTFWRCSLIHICKLRYSRFASWRNLGSNPQSS